MSEIIVTNKTSASEMLYGSELCQSVHR